MPGGPAAIESIAVLPLRNLSGDRQQEYLADALTEELITNLARIKAWRVTSRTSAMRYRDSAKPLPQIASELGVQAVVEGSFRRVGDLLSITTRLVDGKADRTLWAKSYQLDVKNAYALRDELVPAMAADMRLGLPLEEQGRLSRSRQVEPAAYDAYLQGRFYEFRETEEDARTAIGWFRQAIRIDPGYAPAYAALAHTYNTTGQISGSSSHMQQTRRYAEKALELDPGVAEAHVMLGAVKTFYDWDFAGAERELRIALEINGSSADAFTYYAALLDALGKPRQAIAMAQRAVTVDPRRPTLRPDLGFRY